MRDTKHEEKYEEMRGKEKCKGGGMRLKETYQGEEENHRTDHRR